MNAKEKAKELVNKFTFQRESHEMYVAKQCSLICVDEILSINSVDKDYDLSNYWEEVKIEIKAL